jgi:hypothetical protein
MRFYKLNNLVRQIDEKTTNTQQKIGTSCGKFGKLSFVCYI